MRRTVRFIGKLLLALIFAVAWSLFSAIKTSAKREASNRAPCIILLVLGILNLSHKESNELRLLFSNALAFVRVSITPKQDRTIGG